MTTNTGVHTCSYYCERPVVVDDALIAGAMEAAADACSLHVVCNEAIAAAVEYALAQQPAGVGVTKRELFTIAAMHTLRAGDYAKWEHLAQDAVSLADATLAALAAQQQGGRADG